MPRAPARNAVSSAASRSMGRKRATRAPAGAVAGPEPMELAALIGRHSHIDPDQVAAIIGVTKSQLAAALGIPADALYRASRAEAGKTQARLLDLITILSRLQPWAGGIRQALAWYQAQGIAALGDETAEALVRTGRADLVRAYLDGIAAGGHA